MFHATTMMAALLILLGLFHHSSKVYNKLLYQAINSIQIFVTGVELPTTHVVSGLSPSLTVAPGLTPVVLSKGQAEAPPIIQQSQRGWLIMGTSLD